ncbi:MAG: dicarboxylate/amino acid:cation symporter [Fimbriimonadaceae bacterium]
MWQRLRSVPLHTKILVMMVLGAAAGLIAQFSLPGGSSNEGLKWFNDVVAQNVGNLFMTMIFMVVVPLLFSALVNGVAEVGSAAKVGKMGLRALLMTVVLSSIAVGIGLAGVNIVRPGDGIDQAKRTQLFESVDKEGALAKANVAAETQDPPLLGLVPKNPLLEAVRALSGGLLPLMFFAIVFGVALAMTAQEDALPVTSFLNGLFHVCVRMIDFAMKVAPIGVFCLVFRTASVLGGEAFLALAKYMVLVIAALALHFFVTYPLVLKFIAKRNPLEFMRQMRTVIVTAFATSSSNATLPVVLKVSEEEAGIPRHVGSFVLTVGATANQNGTALFEGITILFLAQFFGVQLDFGQQLVVMGLAIVAGIGTAGVPGGAWPMIAAILVRFEIPAEAIGLVLGIDRLLDMSRTVLNVIGDATIAACVARFEGEPIEVAEAALG